MATIMNRKQRRHFEHQLRKLSESSTCSLCGAALEHNCQTFAGFDRHGKVALAAQCCADRLTEIHVMGVFSARDYDFIPPAMTPVGVDINYVSDEKAIDAVTSYRKAITATDKWVDAVTRRSGVTSQYPVTLQDYPWKDDDRIWFERNPTRTHRVRVAFPGEADAAAAQAPADHVLVIPVRQLEPGFRIRGGFFLRADLLPVPDDEAIAHALFDIAEGRELVPANDEMLAALLGKYQAHTDGGQTS
jgi:hypothetical protein